ncbi:hypothetical protein [Janibacter melonis]|uniref:hypothetical protein n=1 Tax=Janibacter melonis TaxID=262209 RepID=UPI00174914BF|nr:hypothetical protein [Janibacter melonis]
MREVTGERTGRPVRSGPGLLLVIAYGTLALAATGRSTLQVLEYFDRAPLAYLLSALAALVYVVATWALLTDRRSVASATITVEAVGVLLVGALSYLAPDLFPDKTVWSHFGSGYGFLPLVLPFVGLWWLRRTAPAGAPTTS